MNNWDIYNLVNYIINKEQTGNTFNSAEFQQVLRKCSFDLIVKLASMYGRNTTVNNELKPFIERDKQINLSSGFGVIPSDYYYHLSTYYDFIVAGCPPLLQEIPVELVDLVEFQSRKSGFYVQADEDYPIMSFDESRVKMFPKTIKSIKMTYIRIPIDPVVATTINQTTLEEEYDAVNSVELEWGTDAKYEIVSMILAYVGINLRSPEIVQISQQQ